MYVINHKDKNRKDNKIKKIINEKQKHDYGPCMPNQSKLSHSKLIRGVGLAFLWLCRLRGGAGHQGQSRACPGYLGLVTKDWGQILRRSGRHMGPGAVGLLHT